MNEFLKNKKTLIALSAVVVLIVLISFIWNAKNKADKNKVPLQTAIVQRGEVVQSIFATGRVIPNFEVEIKGKGSGKIIKLPFDVSDKVKTGDLLVELDPIDEERSVEQASASLSALKEQVATANLNLQVSQRNIYTELAKAKANLSVAETKAQEAKAKFTRAESLFKDLFISKEEYDSNLSNVTQAKTDLNNAKTRLEELKTEELNLKVKAREINIAQNNAKSSNVSLLTAQRRLSETKIYSPIDGVVTSRSGQIGNIVASGINNVGGGTTIMTVADLSKIFTMASIDESDVGRLALGQKVRITADSFPGEIFEGKVVQIASKGVNTSNVITFDAKIEVISENAHKLKPEMTTNIEVIIDKKDNVLFVPVEAITHKGKQKIVQIVKTNDKPEPRIVKTGMNNGTVIEIKEGLEEGEKVVINKIQMNSRWKKDKSSSQGNTNMSRGMMMSGRGIR
jgi:HlyD family secretion protein